MSSSEAMEAGRGVWFDDADPSFTIVELESEEQYHAEDETVLAAATTTASALPTTALVKGVTFTVHKGAPGWKCSACTYQNEPKVLVCICGSRRPRNTSGASSARNHQVKKRKGKGGTGTKETKKLRTFSAPPFDYPKARLIASKSKTKSLSMAVDGVDYVLNNVTGDKTKTVNIEKNVTDEANIDSDFEEAFTSWICRKCTFINDPEALACICGSRRPRGAARVNRENKDKLSFKREKLKSESDADEKEGESSFEDAVKVSTGKSTFSMARWWTPEEDALMLQLFQKYGRRWKLISEQLPFWRDSYEVMNRYISLSKGNKTKYLRWTIEEDTLLLDLIKTHGHYRRWKEFIKLFPNRTVNGLKRRYFHHLVRREQVSDDCCTEEKYDDGSSYAGEGFQSESDPDEKEGKSSVENMVKLHHEMTPNSKICSWTSEEDILMLKLLKKHGRQWKLIADQLPTRRTNYQVRNRYRSMFNVKEKIRRFKGNSRKAIEAKGGVDHTPDEGRRGKDKATEVEADAIDQNSVDSDFEEAFTSWICRKCTFINDAEALACICGSRRPRIAARAKRENKDKV